MLGGLAKLVGNLSLNGHSNTRKHQADRREADNIIALMSGVIDDVERDNGKIEKLVDELAMLLGNAEEAFDVRGTNDPDANRVEFLMAQVREVQFITDNINSHHDSNDNNAAVPTVDDLKDWLGEVRNLAQRLNSVKNLVRDYNQHLRSQMGSRLIPNSSLVVV